MSRSAASNFSISSRQSFASEDNAYGRRLGARDLDNLPTCGHVANMTRYPNMPAETPQDLRRRAAMARRLADAMLDEPAAHQLRDLAVQLDFQAAEAEKAPSSDTGDGDAQKKTKLKSE